MSRVLISTILAGVLATAALADESPDMKAWFERVKSLEGEWVQQGEMMKGARVVYRVTSGGHAVLETLFPGTDHEMLTLYHLEGDDLVLTHYCHVGNRPHMKAAFPGEDAVEFTCVGLEGGEDAGHMHVGRHRFVGPDRQNVRWTYHESGAAQGTVELDLARVAKE